MQEFPITSSKKLRFAVHILMFDCSQFILRTIDNCAPFVEKIYIAYSELPWTYNSEARNLYRNTTSKDIINESPHRHIIELVEGVWGNEEDQRNACLERAKADGFDYLIIQDADEFYTDEAYQVNLDEITRNPADIYTNPWYVFWKSTKYILESKDGELTSINPGFAISCKSDVKFRSCRLTTSSSSYRLSGVAYHLAYALTDEQVLRKISTWGHSQQFNRSSWYYRTWLRWNEATQNLHPIGPTYWRRAVRFDDELPKCLDGFIIDRKEEVSITFLDTLWDLFEDMKSIFISKLKSLKRAVMNYNK